MQYRKDPLISGKLYHVCNKSIAKYVVFNNAQEYIRMIKMIRFFQIVERPLRFSDFIKRVGIEGFDDKFIQYSQKKEIFVRIIAFCLMPTHVHFILEQCSDNGIVRFMSDLLNSYARFFNLRHKRKGPLWQGRFRSILVDQDEYLIHLTRYLHLNPSTNDLVDEPHEWPYSSYCQYLGIGRIIKGYVNMIIS